MPGGSLQNRRRFERLRHSVGTVLLDSAAAELRGLIAMLEKAEELASRAEGLEPYHVFSGRTGRRWKTCCRCASMR